MNGLLILITAIIFFFIGRYSHSDYKEIKDKIKELTKPKPGRLKRPTAKELRTKGTIIEETEKAMEETLDENFKV